MHANADGARPARWTCCAALGCAALSAAKALRLGTIRGAAPCCACWASSTRTQPHLAAAVRIHSKVRQHHNLERLQRNGAAWRAQHQPAARCEAPPLRVSDVSRARPCCSGPRAPHGRSHTRLKLRAMQCEQHGGLVLLLLLLLARLQRDVHVHGQPPAQAHKQQLREVRGCTGGGPRGQLSERGASTHQAPGRRLAYRSCRAVRKTRTACADEVRASCRLIRRRGGGAWADAAHGVHGILGWMLRARPACHPTHQEWGDVCEPGQPAVGQLWRHGVEHLGAEVDWHQDEQ